MSVPVNQSIQLTTYPTWDAFASRFKDDVNPVLEWRRTTQSMVGGGSGDFAVLSTLHHDVDDGKTPFLVELPWSNRVALFIRKNHVGINILPD